MAYLLSIRRPPPLANFLLPFRILDQRVSCAKEQNDRAPGGRRASPPATGLRSRLPACPLHSRKERHLAECQERGQQYRREQESHRGKSRDRFFHVRTNVLLPPNGESDRVLENVIGLQLLARNHVAPIARRFHRLSPKLHQRGAEVLAKSAPLTSVARCAGAPERTLRFVRDAIEQDRVASCPEFTGDI